MRIQFNPFRNGLLMFWAAALVLLSGCGLSVDGSWLAGCDGGASDSKKSFLSFDGDQYVSNRQVYGTTDCTGMAATDNEVKGTFVIGNDVPGIEGAKELDIVLTVPDSKTIYSIIKRVDDTVFVGKKDGDFDGTTAEKRYNVLGGDAHEAFALQ
jgi:hypothetical protein